MCDNVAVALDPKEAANAEVVDHCENLCSGDAACRGGRLDGWTGPRSPRSLAELEGYY